MGPVAIIAGVATAISAGSAYMSHKQGKKAAKQQRRANAYQRSQDNMKAARERREAIRTARLTAAQSQQAAVNQGGQDTSSSLGALGSIQSQLNQGLSFLDNYNALSNSAGAALTQANKHQEKAGTWAAIGQLSQQVASSSAQVFGK